jgi:hypothetical protein
VILTNAISHNVNQYILYSNYQIMYLALDSLTKKIKILCTKDSQVCFFQHKNGK